MSDHFISTEVSFFLSLIQVSHPEKKRIFRYQLHQLIWLAYPCNPAGSNQPFLFHLTGKEDNCGVYCLVQSKEEPDWISAEHRNKGGSIQLKKVLGVKSVQFLIKHGDQFYFSLLACPIKNHFNGYSRGKKFPIFKRNDIENWFVRRSEGHGFKALRYEFSNQLTLVRKQEQANAEEISLSTCQFDGLLEVVDSYEFSKALVAGIGPQKIFGFGMMTIAHPVSFE
ncbi:MAG: type I-E CRISPR-associated protein Cas6/Cse3/CasE [Desulfobulbus sp.]|nr:type I-E CRISPR-associated protein Cas6/Cse3/CasE [Desulfobulbus sp.]